MAQRKRNFRRRLVHGLDQAVDAMREKEHVPTPEFGDPDEVDVKAIRKDLGLSQQEFADAYGFSVYAVRKWEQWVRTPEKGTRVLLMMLRDMPQVINTYLQIAEDTKK
jgi:putative transcriptional regulator